MTKLSLKKCKNPIKVKKQQLCDRINKCKSLKELQEWERVFSFHPVLKDDQDWDYYFFLNLIEFKLKNMSQYFHTHHIVVDEDWYGTLCDRAIAILNAGYKSEVIRTEDLHNYVNERNRNRFLSYGYFNLIDKHGDYYNKYGLATIRIEKAKALFWKFLHHYIEYLWD